MSSVGLLIDESTARLGSPDLVGFGSEAEADALDILPLANMPLQTPRLLRARLIKNIKLDSVIEMFADESGASGQVGSSQIHTYFGWKEGFKHPDQKLLTALGKLASYDVFSSRIALRNLGIELDNLQGMQLSDTRKAQLNKHMRPFTIQLVQQMLGSDNSGIEDFDQLTVALKKKGSADAMANLKEMAEKLQISVQELPKMLEDYADLFLSVAYYQEILDNLIPRIIKFLDEMAQMQSMPDLRRDKNFAREAEALEHSINFVVSALSSRLEAFYRCTDKMWGEISGESFGRLRNMVIANQTLVGGMLCGLTVKIRGWQDAFGGQPLEHNLRKRVQFIQIEMRSGIDKVEALETSAKKRAKR